MRLLVVLGMFGCTKAASPPPTASPPSPPVVSPPSPPAVSPASPQCPPIGTWKLVAQATCAARPEQLVLSVHEGAPDARDPRPMFDVPSPVAAGRTNDGYGYDRLLRVSAARETALGCEMQLHIEYVGPHEALEYKAGVTLAGGRVRGSGTYTLLLDDCDETKRECTCESALTIDGTVH